LAEFKESRFLCKRVAYDEAWKELLAKHPSKETESVVEPENSSTFKRHDFSKMPRKKQKYTMADDGSGIKVTAIFNDPEGTNESKGEIPTSLPSDCFSNASRTPSPPFKEQDTGKCSKFVWFLGFGTSPGCTVSQKVERVHCIRSKRVFAFALRN
jgi:hypothetical protein